MLHLAVKQGGLGYSIKNQSVMFRENMLSFLNVIEAARLENVERMLTTSSACVYPRFCTIPTPETEGFLDEPEPTNSGYGWSKRMAEKMSQWYVEQYGMKIAIARPYNAYGPRDNFDLETSHVIPALIRRIMEGEDPVLVWGSGKQSRAFLYVTDFARGLLEVTEKYPVGDPINIGTDEEVTVGKLVSDICRIAGKQPKIVFDTTKPEGQPRRNCDTRKAKEKVGYTAQLSLEEGLTKTIQWYRENIT